jgi:hypothetical protein
VEVKLMSCIQSSRRKMADICSAVIRIHLRPAIKHRIARVVSDLWLVKTDAAGREAMGQSASEEILRKTYTRFFKRLTAVTF